MFQPGTAAKVAQPQVVSSPQIRGREQARVSTQARVPVLDPEPGRAAQVVLAADLVAPAASGSKSIILFKG